MPLLKVTTCDDTTLHSSRPRHPAMNIDQNSKCISADVQASIGPPHIPLIKAELKEERASNTIKIKMQRKPAMAMLEPYNINMSMFEDRQPEEFLALLKNFSIAIDGTGTTSPSGRIKYLRMMLCGRI